MNSLMRLLDKWRRPTCHMVMKVLQQFLDGELGADDVELVEEHLKECDRCNIEAEIYQQVRLSLAAMRTQPDPVVLARLESMAEDVLANPRPPEDPTLG